MGGVAGRPTMFPATTWDFVLLVVAGYVAVTLLVRLMQNHRRQIMAELQRECVEAQRCQREERQRERRLQADQQRVPTEGERRKRRPENEPDSEAA